MPSLVNASYYSARDFLTSQTIALEASDSNTVFYIHEHLLRSTSPVLLAAISREWNEKTTRLYKFHEEVPEQVLMCFLRWAYHGNYQDGNGNKIISSSANDEYCEDVWGAETIRVFEEGLEPEEDQPTEKPKGPAKDHPEDNLHPLLLNIKLYIFADTYMIELLKTLSKRKIVARLQKLGGLENGNERDAVFDLLTFAFSSRLPEQDVLLHWLAYYASYRLNELKQVSSRFSKLLLEAESNFVTLLVSHVHPSSVNPFSMKTEDVMPRYPTPITRR